MGTESCNEKILWMEQDGEWSRLPEPIQDFTFSYVGDTDNNCDAITLSSSSSFTISIDISNKFHMNAKKFKKKLMAYGISRDDADWLCRAVSMVKGKVSYRDIYLNKVWAMDSVSFYEVFTYILIKGECI